MNEPLLTAVFEDFASAIDYWIDMVIKTIDAPRRDWVWVDDLRPFERVRDSLDGETEDLKYIFTEAMQGLLHSVLTTLDGGTASAEIERAQLVDSRGEILAEGLHELFVDYLLSTDRII